MAGFTIRLDPSISPGTHALVIGVGKYPHLAGGENPIPNPDGMKQLTSPPISARAFAQWLLNEYRYPQKPLASLALLLSEEAPTPFVDAKNGTSQDVETADIANVIAAVTEWKQRGDSHPDNRLIFYFCGHAVSQGNDMALLAADMFADQFNPMNGALDFTTLMKGLGQCKASQQVFFVDGCRASSDLLIERSGADAGLRPLGAGQRPPELPQRCFVPYYATLAGDRSHARAGQVSLFTEALLKGLRGAGSDDPDGNWRVNTSRLHEAIDHFMKQPQFAGAVAGLQVPTVGEMPVFELHQLAGEPLVPVYVGCELAQDNAAAEFVCRQAGREKKRRTAAEVSGDDPNGEWTLELEFGEYEFEAKLRPADVRTKSITVRPTYRQVRLEAKL